MNTNHKVRRVILAVDLKAEDMSLTKRVWEALKPLTPVENTVIEPVTILSREDAAIGTLLKSRIGTLRIATERHLGEKLAEMGLKNLASPKVIFADGSSTQRAVTALIDYAKKTDCALIAVSSQSKKGLDRLFLGSFAETLSLQSPIPMLIVRPNERITSGNLKRILFPTDFSQKSKEALNKVCSAFPEYKPEITLYHSYTIPIQFYMEPFAAFPLPESVIEEEYKKIESLGKNWVREIKNKKFPCKIIIDRKSQVVSDGVLYAAKRIKADMIAMASTTGKLGATLLGSSTRQVLRNSRRPVWVVHPEQRKASKKKSLLKWHSERQAPTLRGRSTENFKQKLIT